MDLESAIWISSIDHLDNYVKVIKSSSFGERLLSNYSLPEGFPRAKNNPLTYFSHGDLTCREDALEYNSFDDSDSKYHSLKVDLSFVLNRSNIKSFEKYTFKEFSPYGLVGTMYMKNWIRIICDDDILGGDFLIGADNVKNLSKLFKMLEQLTKGRQVTERLETNNVNYIYIGYWGIISIYASLFFAWLNNVLSGSWQLIFTTISVLLFASAIISVFIFGIWAGGRNEKVQRHLLIVILNFLFGTVLLQII